MSEVNNAAPTTPEDLVEITSIPQFAHMVAMWHHNIVAQLKQGVDVPDDVVISVGLVEGQDEVDLNADQRLGFKAGLLMALALIEELPFGGIEKPAQVEHPVGGDEGTAL